ncbi:hypothetical protein [Methylotuvimicrobium alcaliphilum]|jgi:hypothetical protein|uniref:hypothetical protein n=1 Tax=Methylotuvimicrobium alcaliphilum TaxID=271065 RepID=UPI0002EE025B|nr:hypothetical protein [Methylotuvimicrobium alcaliphilum]
MQILQEQKSALPPTPVNRVTEPAYPEPKNREVIYDQILNLKKPPIRSLPLEESALLVIAFR